MLYILPMSKSQLNNKLKHHRFLAGQMTQKDLAARAGVSRQSIIAIETGKFRPSVELALRLAAVFETRVEDLFQLDQKEE